jgi:3-hydroxyisobutyrate dehydrogenase-like beta-hydroxyacid dehydrogenase
MKKVAFIGLGNMGFPMAGHLAKAGHDVTVYNRTRARVDDWKLANTGHGAETPKGAASGAEIVFACVGGDDDLRQIAYGDEGALAGMEQGSVFVDHTTASAEAAREVAAEARKHGIEFLDAPVSGGQDGAKNGVLTIMVGGDEQTFADVVPVMESYARAVTHMGPVGNGQLTKMVNQICCVANIQGLAEALNFAQSAGLDAPRVVDVISKGAAQSWQMDNRSNTMLEGKFDFGFAADWMRKDVGFCLTEARKNGALLPLTALIDQQFARLQLRGEGRLDNTALIRLLRDA